MVTRDSSDHTRRLTSGLRHSFAAHFSGEPQAALAPGRVNLIGEHTDYNDGFVLPMAIDRFVGVAFAPRADDRIQVYARDFDEVRVINLSDLEREKHDGWGSYVAGVAWALQRAGIAIQGADLAIQGNVPSGAGLSSSAALEMAVALALCTAAGQAWDPIIMAKAGQYAENEFVGVSCGIMDQVASAASQPGAAMLLDCRSLDIRPVSIPPHACVVVMDTGVRRKLTDGVYNNRFSQCQQAVRIIQDRDRSVQALRDVTPEVLAGFADAMHPTTFRRASHVVAENWRPVQTADAFERGDLAEAGRLMNASHDSLRDLYEVSCAELDGMVDEARRHPACYGARLTGAGLGGCAVALVDRDDVQSFVQEVHEAYRASFAHPAALYVCEPSAGAHLAPLA